MIPPRWRTAALLVAALLPFAPVIAQLMQLGVPADLLVGDEAVLELRTRQAAHGLQSLGPYSRFYWNHPGPAFFYLAVPLYEALGERGHSLHLTALLLNMAASMAIVLTARRLRGDAFAWMVAAGLAGLTLVVLPRLPASPWNPLTPVLPLLLLSLLTARLALGAIALAPAFAFVASAIVQTHVGFGPVVAALTIVASASLLANRAGSRHTQPADSALPVGRAFTAREILVAAVLVLVACWALPLYEEVTVRPGNLTQLWHFFKDGNPEPQAWSDVIGALRVPMAVMPVVAAAFIVASRRHDAELRMFAMIAIAEVAVAVPAIRAIRGELHPYLLYWTTVPAFMTLAVAAAWVSKTRWSAACASIATVVVAALILRVAPHPEWRLYDPSDTAVAQVALDVERLITSQRLARPLVRVVSEDAWITTAAVLVHLQKRGIPFYVEPGWTFMFGKAHEDPGGEHPRLLMGDRTFSLEL